MNYDPRLDSSNVIVRQQAEIEALRTSLIASNSESNGEYARLRLQIETLTASYEGQRRNTKAFAAEVAQALARIDALEGALGEIADETVREPKRSDHESDDDYWEACGVWRMTLKARAALHPQQGQSE